ncbi:MAG: signal peptidase II [Kiloniellaceae bacterium]
MSAAAGMRATDWSTKRALGVALAVAAAVVLLDQASKWVILAAVMQPPRVIEVTGFFNLVLTYNTGISFGMLRGTAPWQAWALVALALAVVAGLFMWLRRQPDPLLAVAVGLVAGGALGNVVDRMRLAAVVDFLDFHLGAWHWPAFNLADSAITMGVALLVFDGLFREARGSKK